MTDYIKNKDNQWAVAPIQGTWHDVGCPDPDLAAVNRIRITNRDSIEFYKRLELWLATTPQKAILPSWLTLGRMPSVGEHDYRSNHEGFHEASPTKD